MPRIGKYSFYIDIHVQKIYIMYFLNMDISITMRLICLKTAIHVPETQLEGRVSQKSFDMDLNLNLIACRSGELQ